MPVARHPKNPTNILKSNFFTFEEKGVILYSMLIEECTLSSHCKESDEYMAKLCSKVSEKMKEFLK